MTRGRIRGEGGREEGKGVEEDWKETSKVDTEGSESRRKGTGMSERR